MKIFFAMDLIGGKAVRLERGDFSRMTVYSDDPVGKIEEMRQQGARDFHVIDLDGARTGSGAHRELIRSIRSRVDGYLEVGGGIRSEEDIAYYQSCNVSGIIVGTRALTDPAFFEDLSRFPNIVLGLDMYEGRIMVKGWKEVVPVEAPEVLDSARRIGIMAILCTNIGRDGMLSGPDYEGMRQLQGITDIPLIASGGVSSVDDLKRLKEMGVWAAIAGKAYYEGMIRIEEAMIYAD
jgi:phosphoribosylformimino-5-aminoimidazole carboxamide ribotide isomerase